MKPTPEILSVLDAAAEGTKAGKLFQSAAMNPYQCGLPEYDAWENGRSSYILFALNTRILLARSVC